MFFYNQIYMWHGVFCNNHASTLVIWFIYFLFFYLGKLSLPMLLWESGRNWIPTPPSCNGCQTASPLSSLPPARPPKVTADTTKLTCSWWSQLAEVHGKIEFALALGTQIKPEDLNAIGENHDIAPIRLDYVKVWLIIKVYQLYIKLATLIFLSTLLMVG